MHRIQCALLATVAVIGFASIASAADMPVKARPMVSPVYNWTGFYIGVNGGYGWSPYSDQLTDLSNAPILFSGLSPKGGFGGGQIGYNWQPVGSPLVLGIEADFQGSNIKNSQTWALATSTSQVTSFGTVRGRIGYAWDTWLLYGTGGFAFGHVNNSEIGGIAYTSSSNGSGYALGGGIEYAFMPKWSVKAEYQYITLGNHVPTSPAGVALTSFPGVTVHRDAFNTVRLGLNYKF